MPEYLVKHYNPAIIWGTLAIAFVGSYAAITVYELYRICSKENKPKLLNSTLLLWLMAISIGGVAIWCMHFVAMVGLTFTVADTNDRVDVTYRLDLTLVSLFVVILLAYCGLYICSISKAFTKDKRDVVDQYIQDVQRLTIKEIRNITSKKELLFRSLFIDIYPIIVGGILTGTGVCVMHYIGMQASVFQGHIQFNIGIVTASVIIACIAASAAFWILFRLLALFPDIELLRVACAIIMSIAVNGMHYTGMHAGNFVYLPDKIGESQLQHLDRTTAAMVALIFSCVVIWITLTLANADLRVWYYQQSMIVRETDILASQHKGTRNDSFLNEYKQLRANAPSGNIISARTVFRQGNTPIQSLLPEDPNDTHPGMEDNVVLPVGYRFVPEILTPGQLSRVSSSKVVPFNTDDDVCPPVAQSYVPLSRSASANELRNKLSTLGYQNSNSYIVEIQEIVENV